MYQHHLSYSSATTPMITRGGDPGCDGDGSCGNGGEGVGCGH